MKASRIRSKQNLANTLRSMDRISFNDILMRLSFKKHYEIQTHYGNIQVHVFHKK